MTHRESLVELDKWLDVSVGNDEQDALDRALFLRCKHAVEVEQRLAQNADIPAVLESIRREHPELSDKLIPLHHRLRGIFEGVL